jgi:replicative DNA helicase
MKQTSQWAKKKRNTDSVFEQCKSPPQAIDLEEAIIGSLMLESQADHVKTVLLKLRPEHFYKESHKLLLNAIKTLQEQDFPIDILTVTEQCRKNGNLELVGGAYGITILTSRISSTVNIDFWFRIIYQKFLQREINRIGLQKADIAMNDSTDVFDLLEDFITELETLDPLLFETVATTADSLADEMITEFDSIQSRKSKKFLLPMMVYNLGWPRFDEVISLAKDKIILIAGAASAGKSRFIRTIIYRLLERHPDISVCWISLEDSRQDLLRSYLASKVFITAKHLKSMKYDHSMIDEMKGFTREFQQFDIEFIDQAIRSDDIVTHFVQFCDQRKDRFNILVVDNILSLDDQGDFKFDPNGFSNHVMHNLLKCRQKTKGLIIPLHHFNDAQQNKENLSTGYRPVLKDMKGSETFRRTPNQVLLINSFNIYKDLMSEYTGIEHDILEHMFIVDAGKNREDKIGDSAALIHFFTEMAYDQFWEIPLPGSIQTNKKQSINKSKKKAR